ncbi:hypothetical protein AMS68_006957 [Peltaster fructicola]|uniref:Uncharacterized protein n=1 Tax=Peltaster fructicola TaxID=286661 RepID=A0A6H0Y498_9PEZI|nr:hypothetical protein AMS68_006957 [Peltaster fructicola]
MQASARQQELERLYNARKGHVPQISISDDSHHITEAIGSYYGDEEQSTGLGVKVDHRPLSYMSAPSEARFTAMPRSTSLSNRHAAAYDGGERPPMPMRRSSERVPKSPPSDANGSPTGFKSLSPISAHEENVSTPPSLSRHNSTDTATQSFPLNDIDYESSPAAVAQELSNLQAIRRMSMNVDTADPDLPAFGSVSVPTSPPGQATSEDDPSKLFWVPARLHPELAPKEFKTFVEERVDKIRRRSGSEDSLSPDSLDRSGSGGGLRRKKSMLSHQIDTRGDYQDGADRLERRRSKGIRVEGATTIANLHDLEELVNDPAQLVRRMSLDQQRRSEDSESDVPEGDVILPGLSQTLKRSTRTTYRRGSLRKGERVPFSKRALSRQSEQDGDEQQQLNDLDFDLPTVGISRVQTEPMPETRTSEEYMDPPPRSKQRPAQASYPNVEPERNEQQDLNRQHIAHTQQQAYEQSVEQQQQQQHAVNDRLQRAELAQPQPPQHRQFQSRIASQGRTTAQLPGYHNTNPLPNIIETLPDGTKVPVGPLANQAQQFPERKSSFEMNRAPPRVRMRDLYQADNHLRPPRHWMTSARTLR